MSEGEPKYGIISQFTKREMTTHEVGTDPDFEGVHCKDCSARNLIVRGGAPLAGQLCCNCKKPLVVWPLATDRNGKFWKTFLGG